MCSPLNTLHTPIVLSQDPDAKYSPLGEKTTLSTDQKCPVRVFSSSLLITLHILIVRSIDPDAKFYPLGEKSKLKTG